MRHYVIDPLALDDIESIYRYIATDSPRAAVRVVDRFYSLFDLLINQPEMGELRNDLAPNLRTISSGKYLVLFRPISDGVMIVQVVHSARDLDAVLRKPN